MNLQSCSRPFSLACLATLALACSSSSGAPTGTTGNKDGGKDAASDSAADGTVAEATAPGTDAHPDVIIDPHNCVAPGATSAGAGVGGYCSPGGGQCLHAGPGGSATTCTADIFAPPHEWFCTVSCTTTSDCGGGGGTCLSAPFGQICVPASCANGLGDASSTVVDAGTGADAADAAEPHDGAAAHDAASDGHTDALHDAAAHHDAASATDAATDGHAATSHDAGDAH